MKVWNDFIIVCEENQLVEEIRECLWAAFSQMHNTCQQNA